MDQLRGKAARRPCHDPDLTEGALASLAKAYGLVSHAATKREVEEHMPVHELELICCLYLQGVGPHRGQPPAGFELVRAKTGKAERDCQARRRLMCMFSG